MDAPQALEWAINSKKHTRVIPYQSTQKSSRSIDRSTVEKDYKTASSLALRTMTTTLMKMSSFRSSKNQLSTLVGPSCSLRRVSTLPIQIIQVKISTFLRKLTRSLKITLSLNQMKITTPFKISALSSCPWTWSRSRMKDRHPAPTTVSVSGQLTFPAPSLTTQRTCSTRSKTNQV